MQTITNPMEEGGSHTEGALDVYVSERKQMTKSTGLARGG